MTLRAADRSRKVRNMQVDVGKIFINKTIIIDATFFTI